MADAYWRSYFDSALSSAREEAIEDIDRYLEGGYGRPTLSESRVVRSDRAVAGALLAVMDVPYPDVPRGPFIIDLFVSPQHRRLGVGRSLIAALTGIGNDAVGLRVERDNVAARSLHDMLGFQLVHELSAPLESLDRPS